MLIHINIILQKINNIISCVQVCVCVFSQHAHDDISSYAHVVKTRYTQMVNLELNSPAGLAQRTKCRASGEIFLDFTRCIKQISVSWVHMYTHATPCVIHTHA